MHAPDHAAKPSRTASRFWFWGVSLVVLAALAVGAARLDWEAVAGALAHTHPLWFAAACGSFMTLPVLMAAEWRLIGARPVEASGGMRTLLPLGCFTYFLQTYLNAAVAYGTALLRLVRGRGWTIGQGAGLVMVDQLAEGIARGVFCSVVLLSAAGSWTNSPGTVGLIGLSVLVVAGFAALKGKPLVRRMAASRLTRSGHAVEAVDEVLAVMKGRSFAWGITGATAKKVAKIGAVIAIQRALGLDGSPWIAIYFVAVLECATTLPLVPSNLGVIESAAATVYASQGLSPEVGLSVGILYRAGIYLATALMAAAATAGAVVSRRLQATEKGEARSTLVADPQASSKAA